MFVHMKYNKKNSIFLALNPRAIGHDQHFTHMHIFLENIDSRSYDSKHTFINIFITKTHNLPNIYKKTYPTYE